jgi:hypothetical protein
LYMQKKIILYLYLYNSVNQNSQFASNKTPE